MQRKLERSMDRFFARVEVGKYVKRVNWSITTGAELFAAFGEVHGSVEEQSPSSEQGSRAMKLEELDLDKVCYYCLIAAWKDADIYRRFCAVSVRLCIVFPILRLWSLLFILIHIPYSGLRMRGLVRSWWLRLMGLRKGMYLLWTPTRGVMFGGRPWRGLCGLSWYSTITIANTLRCFHLLLIRNMLFAS
jgi:Protein of unknown function (DUF3445).